MSMPAGAWSSGALPWPLVSRQVSRQPRMTVPNDYIQANAVIRVDGDTMDSDARVSEWVIDGKVQPTAGPANVRVKQILMTAQEARDEVIRLNQLNASKGCKYFWQPTHLFLHGGSHGSDGRTIER